MQPGLTRAPASQAPAHPTAVGALCWVGPRGGLWGRSPGIVFHVRRLRPPGSRCQASSSSRNRTLAPWRLPPSPGPGRTRSWSAWRERSSGGSCKCRSSGRRSSIGTRCSARQQCRQVTVKAAPEAAPASLRGWTELATLPTQCHPPGLPFKARGVVPSPSLLTCAQLHNPGRALGPWSVGLLRRSSVGEGWGPRDWSDPVTLLPPHHPPGSRSWELGHQELSVGEEGTAGFLPTRLLGPGMASLQPSGRLCWEG